MRTVNTARWSVAVVCGVLLALSGGCTSTQMAIEDPFFEKWQSAKQQSRHAVAQANEEIVLAEEPPVEEEIQVTVTPEQEADQRLPTTLVNDLALAEKTPVAVVLRTLADAGDQNILIGEGVTQTIQMSFDNVPWNEAFKSILSSAGLTYEWDGDIIRVMSLEDMQRKLEMERLKQESQALQAATREVEPMYVRMVRIKFSNAGKLGPIISKVLEGKGPAGAVRGSVTVDEDNNTIIVHAIKSDLDKIMHLIARLDRPKPQVLIESKIVETNRSTARELGIQWGGGAETIGANRMHTVSGVGLDGFAVNTPAALTDTIGFSLGYRAERLGGGDFLELQLTALQQDGKINILSSPSITTLDNETAIIEAGEERAYRET
jgi:type IV pilus assembly protein PilQ